MRADVPGCRITPYRGGAAGLEPLISASRAEGFGFVGRLAEALKGGAFDAPGTALFGAYDEATLLGIGGSTPDPG